MKTRSQIKVCHLSSAHTSTDIRIFRKECTSLAHAGYNVTFIVGLAESEEIEGVKIIGLDYKKGGRSKRMYKGVNAVYREALIQDADIYHFHDPELLRIALKLKRKGKVVIYDIHEDVPKQILSKHWINKYLRKLVSNLFKSYENYIASRLDYLITATPVIEQIFKQVNPNTIAINNYPLESEYGSISNWSDKKRQICYVGGISQIRGLKELIDSLEFVKSDVRLLLAGKFSPASFEQELKTLKGWEKVDFVGLVGRERLTELLAESMIGMVTFLPVPNHIDAQPNKMFEYMSSGIPVIGSNFNLWKDILEKHECGVCVDPADPQAIAKAIDELAEDSDKAKSMGEKGINAVYKYFNWSAEFDKLLKVYDQLAGTSN